MTIQNATLAGVEPKIELHVHLEGTIRARTLLAIARRNVLPLPADTVEGLAELYRFRDFPHFLKVWGLTTNCLRTADDFRQDEATRRKLAAIGEQVSWRPDHTAAG